MSLSHRIGWLSVAVLTTTAVWSAWDKGTSGKPEWLYHRLAAAPEFSGGLEVHNPGYLPGFAGFIAPFFQLPDGLGLALFIALGCMLSAVTIWLLHREYWSNGAGPGRRFTPWFAVWMIPPLWLGIRNNQVMVWMLAPLLLALASWRHKRLATNGALIGLAAVVKTLPVTLLPFLVLRRKLPLAITAGLFTLTLSVVLGGWHYGWAESLELHLKWPANARGQDPIGAIGAVTEPRFFGDNMSARAWLVRSADVLGETVTGWVCEALLYGSLVISGWVTWRRRKETDLARDSAHWLAWVALASPFGRYYYVCMLLPAWCLLSRSGNPWMRSIGWSGPLLALATRSDGVYPILVLFTYVAMVAHCVDKRGAANPIQSPLTSR